MTDRRLRIALVTDAIGPYHHGGKEQRYLELAPRLAERADVHIYTMNWWRGKQVRRDRGVTYHAIAPYIPLYSGRRRSIRQAIVFAICCLRLLFEPFDVLEADHMPYIQLLPLKLVSVLRRRRLVVTWHECWGPEYWRAYLGPAGRIGWLFESVAMRLPDAIIAASPETASRLAELTRPSVPVIPAPNGIDLAAIEAITPAADADAAEIVVVGRLLAHKRVDLLLDAVAQLRDAGQTLTVLVIGSGPELEHLRQQAEALRIAPQVTFESNVRDHPLLLGMLKAARVAVFPSEREGFGIAVLEALACRVPVVTTSAPHNLSQHLVRRAGQGGIVCDPSAEAIAAAIRSVLKRPTRSAGGVYEWLDEYDWEAVTVEVAAALAPKAVREQPAPSTTRF